MFNSMKNRILGSKASGKTKSNPYRDIPIFDDVDSIGMPGLAGTRKMDDESKHADSPEAKQASTPVRSTGKRSRRQLAEEVEGILQDKENIPKIPKAANANIMQMEAPFGKVPTQGSDLKKMKKSVTIDDTATIFNDSEDMSSSASSNALYNDALGDNRFATDRQEARGAKRTSVYQGSSSSAPTGESKHGDDEAHPFMNRTPKTSEEYCREGPNDRHLNDFDIEERIRMREFLFSKVRHNHYDVVESSIKGGQHDFKGRFAVDGNGNTLMHVAVQNNLKKMCSLLMNKAQVPLNVENHKLMTPLDYAELYKFAPLAEWLLSKGAVNGRAPRQ